MRGKGNKPLYGAISQEDEAPLNHRCDDLKPYKEI
jgi:hypothetical protein